eukprot:IDg11114t1
MLSKRRVVCTDIASADMREHAHVRSQARRAQTCNGHGTQLARADSVQILVCKRCACQYRCAVLLCAEMRSHRHCCGCIINFSSAQVQYSMCAVLRVVPAAPRVPLVLHVWYTGGADTPRRWRVAMSGARAVRRSRCLPVRLACWRVLARVIALIQVGRPLQDVPLQDVPCLSALPLSFVGEIVKLFAAADVLIMSGALDWVYAGRAAGAVLGWMCGVGHVRPRYLLCAHVCRTDLHGKVH